MPYNFKRYRWLMFSIIGTLYFLVCLHRVSPTVIARDLSLSFNADAVALGIISSSYFYLYSAVQPVVGYLSDTVGPRRVMTVSFLVASLGSMLFALAPDTSTAVVGRALVGAGVGGVFIPSLKLFSRWYRANEFAGLTGIMLTIGGIAGLSATLPLTYLVLWTGWRGAFGGIAVVSLVLAFLCWFVVRNNPLEREWSTAISDGLIPADSPAHSNSGAIATPGVIRRLSLVFGSFNFWMISLSTFFTAGVFLTFQGLWGVPYLMDVFRLDRVSAGGIIMLFPLGFAVGGPTLGMVTEKLLLDHKKVLLSSIGIAVIGWSLLFFIENRDFLYLGWLLFFIFGFTAGGALPISFTITRDLFPPELMGTAVGLMNTAPFLGAALYQPLTGLILQGSPGDVPGTYCVDAYMHLIILFMASGSAALLATSLLRRGR